MLSLVAFLGSGPSANGVVVRPGAASIEVADQSGPWGVLVVRKVVTPAPSWVVVQARQGNETLGPVLGFAPVPAGTSSDVSVALDPKQGAVNTLVVSLLADRGRQGALEFSATGSGGGGGMGGGGGGMASQGGAASTPTTATLDKPLIAAGKPISAVLGETFRDGTPGNVHRVVQP